MTNRAHLPPIAVDVDGVIARPHLGINIGVSAGTWRASALTRGRLRDAGWFGRHIAALRYSGKAVMPGVAAALRDLAQHRRVVLVTARPGALRDPLHRWLNRYGLAPYIDEVRLNDAHLPVAVHKLRAALEIRATEFIEDDGRNARYLVENGIQRVFLVDWPRNRGTYTEAVTVVRGIDEVGRLIATGSSVAATGNAPF